MENVQRRSVAPLWIALASFGMFIALLARCSVETAPRSSVARCFSSLNGSHPELVQAVRDSLHDPASFQHVGTVLAGQDGSQQRAVVMTYRARNLMGGTVTSRASAWIFPPHCGLNIISVQH